MIDVRCTYTLPEVWGSCYVVARYVTPGSHVSAGQSIMSVKVDGEVHTVVARSSGEVVGVGNQFGSFEGGAPLFEIDEQIPGTGEATTEVRPAVFQKKDGGDNWISFDDQGRPYEVWVGKNGDGETRAEKSGSHDAGEGESVEGDDDVGTTHGSTGTDFKSSLTSRPLSLGGILVALIGLAIVGYFFVPGDDEDVESIQSIGGLSTGGLYTGQDLFGDSRLGIIAINPNNEHYVRIARNDATRDIDPAFLVWDSREVTVVDLLAEGDVLVSNGRVIKMAPNRGDKVCRRFEEGFFHMAYVRNLGSGDITEYPIRACDDLGVLGEFSLQSNVTLDEQVMEAPGPLFLAQEEYAYYRATLRDVPVSLDDIWERSSSRYLVDAQGNECEVPTREYTKVSRVLQYNQELELVATLETQSQTLEAYAFGGDIEEFAPEGCVYNIDNEGA